MHENNILIDKQPLFITELLLHCVSIIMHLPEDTQHNSLLYCIPEALLSPVVCFCRQELNALIPHPCSSEQSNQSSHAATTHDKKSIY